MPKKPAPLTLAEKIDLLFAHGQAQGVPTSYRAIAEATGESHDNVQKVRRGQNANPSFRLVARLARYFGVSLAYFECETLAACQAFLAQQRQQVAVARAESRIAQLSPLGMRVVEALLDFVVDQESRRRRPIS